MVIVSDSGSVCCDFGFQVHLHSIGEVIYFFHIREEEGCFNALKSTEHIVGAGIVLLVTISFVLKLSL